VVKRTSYEAHYANFSRLQPVSLSYAHPAFTKYVLALPLLNSKTSL